jgi:ribosome-associated protein
VAPDDLDGGADEGVLVVNRGLRIPMSELELRFSRSGGPGGQHVNTSSTKVEVRFDVEGSPSLGPRQRARLLERLGPVVRVTSSQTRSQLRNREVALGLLAERLAEALKVDPTRVATRPSRSAKAKRTDAKRRRGDVKRTRRRPDVE